MGVTNWRAACIIDKVVRAGEGGDPSRPTTFLATQTSCNLLQLSRATVDSRPRAHRTCALRRSHDRLPPVLREFVFLLLVIEELVS